MRRAIEKLTFSLLSLAVASLLTFVMLARVTDGGGPPAALPLLVNPAPRNARDFALKAAADVARGGAGARASAQELQRLGGAAFPHVLPNLDALEPAARGRVAMALAPVAFRMGVADRDDFDTAERAIGFFTRYWEDRSADFRSTVVRRKVARLAERALPLRQKEVRELDTFALPELLEALGQLRGAEDARRAGRLVPVIAHATGLDVALAEEASLEEARRVVTRVRAFALAQGPDFVTLDGPGRLSATVIQTRYFRWLTATIQAASGADAAGAEDLRRVRSAGGAFLLTSLLVLSGALAAAILLLRLRQSGAWRGAGLLHVALVVSAFPATLATLRGAAVGRAVGWVALGAVLAATLVHEVIALGAERRPIRRAIARAGALVPVALAGELALEAFLGHGLGALARKALAVGDLATLMWASFPLAALGLVGVALGELDRPVGTTGTPSELEPPRPRRLLVALVAGGVGVLTGLGGLGWLQGARDGLGAALGATLWLTLVALTAAALVGLVLGVLAGGISQTAAGTLGRLQEIVAGLPQPLTAAFALTFGGLWGALLLGLLRGLDVAALLGGRLNERRLDEAMEQPSGGGTPLAPYLERLLPHAARATAVALALSVPWVLGMAGAAAVLHRAEGPSLAALVAEGGGVATTALLLAALLGLAPLLLASWLTPSEWSGDVPSATVALALRPKRKSTTDGATPDHTDEPS
jgi:peptide/nickel transport system permease protein